MIDAERLTLRVGERVLFRDASFRVRDGEFVAVLGANGAGKTTLLRTLAGVRAADGGSVRAGGRDICTLRPAERARLIAHIAADELFIDRLTVRDVVAMGRYAHHQWWQWREEDCDESAVREALSAVGMDAFAGRRFDTLSSGERQRIWIALALAQDARLLLLDEPTSHLDVRVAREILELLMRQAHSGRSVICVLHDVNEAVEFADRILLIGCGRVLAFDEPERAATPELLYEAYGVRMERLRTASGHFRVFAAGATIDRRLPGGLVPEGPPS